MPGPDLQQMAGEGLQKAGGQMVSGFLGSAVNFVVDIFKAMLPWALGALALVGLDKWLNDGKLTNPILSKLGFGKDDKDKAHGTGSGTTPPAPAPAPADADKAKAEAEAKAKAEAEKAAAEAKAKAEAEAKAKADKAAQAAGGINKDKDGSLLFADNKALAAACKSGAIERNDDKVSGTCDFSESAVTPKPQNFKFKIQPAATR